jgi:large subunit ribosomal protein L24
MKVTAAQKRKVFLKKGDTVKVLSGSERNKTGRVLKVMPKRYLALVEGINIVTKHIKTDRQYGGGGLVTIEAPLYIAKLQVIDPQTGKPTRIRRVRGVDGSYRVSVRTGSKID